jgi:hypothetical protein
MKKLMLISLLSLFSFSVFSQIPNYVPANGLVGWWPFNGNANDESGNGNNGTVNGATLSTDRNGYVNSAYSFLNQNSKISLSTITSDSITSISISGWFKKITAGVDGAIFAMSNGCFGADGPRLFIGNENFLYWQVEKTTCIGFGVYSNQINYSDNNWHFFAAIYTKTNPTYVTSDFSLYVDGINLGLSNPNSTQGIISPLSNSFFSTTFGNTNTNLNGFTGLVDDIGIWNRALTVCEIQNLYTSTSPTNTTTVSVCDSYNWNGTTYNSSGVYSGTTTNCVTETLDLTITTSSTNTTTVSACDSYSWNGQTYIQSGVYSGPTTNCVSESLNLTVNSSTSSTQSQTALDSYTWSLNNQTYTQSGTYVATIPNAAGCDSVVTLNLTLNFTGIFENSEAQISIAPNPASDNVLLKVSEQFLGKNYLIYDNSGRKIMEGIISQKEMIIKIGAFDDGIYLIKVNNEIQNTFRIIKQ